MATEVKKYNTLIYGSPSGYQTNRAQIALYDSSGKTVAYVRFNDPGMNFESDSESGGRIKMHLPSTMFENVLDVLRNEKHVYVYFAQGRGFINFYRTSWRRGGIASNPGFHRKQKVMDQLSFLLRWKPAF